MKQGGFNMKKNTIQSWIIDVMRETECVCGKKFCFQKDEKIVYCYHCDTLYQVNKNGILEFVGYRCYDKKCEDIPHKKIYYYSECSGVKGLPFCKEHFIDRQKELEHRINSHKQEVIDLEFTYKENNLKLECGV